MLNNSLNIYSKLYRSIGQNCGENLKKINILSKGIFIFTIKRQKSLFIM